MIKDVSGRFDDYSISPVIRKVIALGLGVSWRWFVMISFFVHIKMSYYYFNRQQLLQKAKDKYYNGSGKEEAAEYYIKCKEGLRENAKK